MSIKQGEYLKNLRKENKFSQEQLAEKLNISRQSISKWEQGTSTPDIENFAKLAQLYNVSVDSLINGEPETQTEPEVQLPLSSVTVTDEEKNPEPKKKKRSWFFISYPIITVIIYAIIGTIVGKMGWAIGWIVFLTIPLFYTTIFAIEKKKPIIFCYPVLVTIIFLLCGLLLNKWHPMWILFLTIPIFYIATAKRKQ